MFRFREFTADDFPKLGEPALKGAVSVDGGAFAAAIGQVSVAASTDDARPVLTGVFFETEAGRLRMVATDSYRLAVRDVPTVEAPLSGLVPVRALRDPLAPSRPTRFVLRWETARRHSHRTAAC